MSSVSVGPLDPVLENAGQSLEERMRAADADEVSTEKFPVPGWGSFVWVELKVIGHEAQRAQVEKNRRIRKKATLDLYVAADTILAATVGFHEVRPGAEESGDDNLMPVQTDWRRLGIAVKKMGKETTPRQALIRLIGNERVVPFYGEYIEWLTSERSRGREDGAEDFQTTP